MTTLKQFFDDLRAHRSTPDEEDPPEPERAGTAGGAGGKPPPDPGTKARSVEILFDGRKLTSVHTDSSLGKLQFKTVHPDAQFLSERQFRVFRDAGRWMIEHVNGATNETIVDGRKLARPEPIRDRMQVAVGNASKGIVKFQLELRLGS